MSRAERAMPAGPASRLLLTGFEPFGGEIVNPSQVLVSELAATPGCVAGLQLSAEILPVDRARLPGVLDGALQRHRPAAVLCVGQATGRSRVDLETLAHNGLDFRGERDNGGHVATGELLEPGGPDRLPSTLPLAALAAALVAQGLPVGLSADAGRHLCNALLYRLLRRHAGIPAGFVHVPLLPEQAARRSLGEPALPLEVSRACLLALLHRLAAELGARPAAGA